MEQISLCNCIDTKRRILAKYFFPIANILLRFCSMSCDILYSSGGIYASKVIKVSESSGVTQPEISIKMTP